MTRTFLGLGSDTGDRIKNLSDALAHIEKSIGKTIRSSSVYETEPWGFESEMKFLNQVVEVETELNPSGLLGRILRIEAEMGRLRDRTGYSSRIIDVDILFYKDEIIDYASLQIPHPRLHERKFVLVPLNEIAPDLIHPVYNKKICILLKECKDESEVVIF